MIVSPETVAVGTDLGLQSIGGQFPEATGSLAGEGFPRKSAI
jgi:hypothetical protein